MKYWYRLVRFGFRLLYNEFAFTYDIVSSVVSMGAWRCWGRSALKHLNAAPNDRMLEIAHGTGNLQLDLHDAGYRVIGIDLSPQMGKITLRKLRAANRRPRLVRTMAQSLPFPTGTFAVVISTFPAEFIIAQETLREVNRVLKPSGRFVIVPNAVFTSKGAGAQGLELLYRVTGQREESPNSEQSRPKFDVVAYFASFGFEVTVHQEPCPRSVATVIVAEKHN